VLQLQKVDGTTLEVMDVDILDGTPLLDIKP
jgi:tRNA (Thr-GGU) A37 N-methylase